MPLYNYICSENCTIDKLTEEQVKKLAIEEHPDGILVWTERHGMHDKPEIKCPACGNEARLTYHGVETTFFFRGNCYLNREDCKRQMDIRLLESGNDPYKHMRQPGETDDLKQRLKKKKTPKR